MRHPTRSHHEPDGRNRIGKRYSDWLRFGHRIPLYRDRHVSKDRWIALNYLLTHRHDGAYHRFRYAKYVSPKLPFRQCRERWGCLECAH